MKVLIPDKAMDEVEQLAGTAGANAQFDFAKNGLFTARRNKPAHKKSPDSLHPG